MILDSYFAIACVLLLAALVAVVAVAANALRREREDRQAAEELVKLLQQDVSEWGVAYEARDAQLAEARTRIDTLEGELTAADIALSQARKNDHRDAKGRFAKAA